MHLFLAEDGNRPGCRSPFGIWSGRCREISWACWAELAIEMSCTMNLAYWGTHTTLARHYSRVAPFVCFLTGLHHCGTEPGRSLSSLPLKVITRRAATSALGLGCVETMAQTWLVRWVGGLGPCFGRLPVLGLEIDPMAARGRCDGPLSGMWARRRGFYALIALISGTIPRMFMTRVRL
jgi:hypothetical protein